MPDITLTCKDCRNPFFFTERDQEFFAKQGYTEPKRCKPCRDEKKLKQAQQDARPIPAPEPAQDDRRNLKGRDRRGGGQKGHW